MNDSNQRFLFDHLNIRGQIARLDKSLSQVLAKHEYPPKIQKLIGEFMAASVLLASTVKFKGTLILQLAGQGQLRTVMAECNHNSGVRAIARYNDDFSDNDPLMTEGQLLISILPEEGDRYQGIVEFDPLQGLSTALETYFERSEQIKTRIWLACDTKTATGYLIQALPESATSSSLSDIDDMDGWNRIEQLSETIKPEEMLNLDNQTLLYRLFHEENPRLFEANAVKFQCTCSAERSAGAVLQLGEAEANEILKEQGFISIDCQFCLTNYHFSAEQVSALFTEHRNKSN